MKTVFRFLQQISLPMLCIIFTAVILMLSIRGIAGNPTSNNFNSSSWRENGPFEQSGRFALLYSVLEDHSFQFSLPVAQFATPDLAIIHNHYVSLFAPGVSFIGMPGYLVGKILGISQVGTFAMIALFALVNMLLIMAIAIRLGANKLASAIAGLTFLFATPAYAYAVDFYQHHISTFLILLSIYCLIRYKNFFSYMLVWFLCGTSIVIDYSNLFMILPIGLYTLFGIVSYKIRRKSMDVELHFGRLFNAVSAIIPVLFLLWFNFMSFGNPLQLSGSLPRVEKIQTVNNKQINKLNIEAAAKITKTGNTNSNTSPKNNEINAITFFNPRYLLNGFFVLFISPDRGTLIFTPIMILGVIGLIIAYRRRIPYLSLFVAVIGINILLYAMWGDPWGGWAFGARYLIPSYAILSIFIAIYLTRFGRKNIFLLLFLMLFSYSTAVNTLGALTTSNNPPMIEAQALEKISGVKQDYTYVRNFNYLNTQGSKAFIYTTFAKHFISAWDYYLDIIFSIIIFTSVLLVISKISLSRKENNYAF